VPFGRGQGRVRIVRPEALSKANCLLSCATLLTVYRPHLELDMDPGTTRGAWSSIRWPWAPV